MLNNILFNVTNCDIAIGVKKCKESKVSRSKEKQQQKKRDVERETARLLSPTTKEQTKNRGHLITRALDQRGSLQEEKETDEGMRCIWEHVCVCANVCVLSGEGVKACKQVPIVQQGVMREVMRVWVSRAAHYKCTVSGPKGSRGLREEKGVVGINEDRGAQSR